MSDISFNCPQCGAEIAADSQFAGDTAQCPSCNSILLVPMPGISGGMTLGDFKIIKRLGLGGMGEVWLAEQEAMKRKVALKILAPHLTKDEDFVNRFMQEVQLAGKLTHPNIVTAFHAGEDRGIYYLAMEFIDGCELENLLTVDKMVDEATALKVIRDIAVALDYAWSKFQILHRDIKPSNIMISSEGEGLLMDMGISKSLIEDNSLTMAGEIIGTPYYMSPEQAQADNELDFRADLYSLGATLYHVVTGSTPFDADSAVGILTQHITAPLVVPTTINSNLSDQCSELIKIMMKKNPNDRQASWKELIDDIDLVLNHKYPKGTNRSLVTSTLQALDKACLSPEAKPINKVALIASLILVITSLIALTIVLKPKRGSEVQVKDLDEMEPQTVQIVKQPEVVIPEKTVPKLQTVVKQTDKESLVKKVWQKAVDFDDSNVGEFDKVIDNYEKVIGQLTGTEFEENAKKKVADLYAAKESAIQQVMDQLEKETQKLVNKGDFRSAADYYESYKGEYAAETEKRRNREALRFLKMKVSPNGKSIVTGVPKEAKASSPSDTNANIMLDICAPLIKGEYEKAYNVYKSSDSSPLPKTVGKTLSELNTIDKIVINTLEKYYKTKKRVPLTVNRLRGNCTIIEFNKNKNKMRVEFKVKNVTTKPRLAISSISQIDKENILENNMSTEAYAIFYGNKILKLKKDIDRARTEYRKAPYFFPYIDKTLFPKSAAEVAFVKLLEPLGLNPESVKMLTRESLNTDIDLKVAAKTREDLKVWRDKFESTPFFKTHQYSARDLYNFLWAYTILKEDRKINSLYTILQLTAEQVIEIKNIIEEKDDPWVQKGKILEILTQEQRQLFHQSRPGRPEEKQRPGWKRASKRQF